MAKKKAVQIFDCPSCGKGQIQGFGVCGICEVAIPRGAAPEVVYYSSVNDHVALTVIDEENDYAGVEWVNCPLPLDNPIRMEYF